jgi:hypothetical protein
MKLRYIVACKIENSFGASIQGIGAAPLILLEKENSDQSLGFIGDGLINSCQIISDKTFTRFDVVNKYIQLSGLSDYKKCFNNSAISESFLFEFIIGVIEGDLSDFRYENDVNVDLISGDEIHNDYLEKHLDQVGIWFLEKEISKIEFNSQDLSLYIDSLLYEDLGALVNEVLISNPDVQTLAIIN